MKRFSRHQGMSLIEVMMAMVMMSGIIFVALKLTQEADKDINRMTVRLTDDQKTTFELKKLVADINGSYMMKSGLVTCDVTDLSTNVTNYSEMKVLNTSGSQLSFVTVISSDVGAFQGQMNQIVVMNPAKFKKGDIVIITMLSDISSGGMFEVTNVDNILRTLTVAPTTSKPVSSCSIVKSQSFGKVVSHVSDSMDLRPKTLKVHNIKVVTYYLQQTNRTFNFNGQKKAQKELMKRVWPTRQAEATLVHSNLESLAINEKWISDISSIQSGISDFAGSLTADIEVSGYKKMRGDRVDLHISAMASQYVIKKSGRVNFQVVTLPESPGTVVEPGGVVNVKPYPQLKVCTSSYSNCDIGPDFYPTYLVTLSPERLGSYPTASVMLIAEFAKDCIPFAKVNDQSLMNRADLIEASGDDSGVSMTVFNDFGYKVLCRFDIMPQERKPFFIGNIIYYSPNLGRDLTAILTRTGEYNKIIGKNSEFAFGNMPFCTKGGSTNFGTLEYVGTDSLPSGYEMPRPYLDNTSCGWSTVGDTSGDLQMLPCDSKPVGMELIEMKVRPNNITITNGVKVDGEYSFTCN